ncbi:hypothetical protein NY98_22485 [Xanthomonas citri pv. fuscans]|uniref:Uncharacterized protein n=1 Tax=Xanthomonas citri pv. fuscans TaxID=366649 RepID=A0AB34SRX7_XANCI|nr:hypothetical protein AC613_05425 [Xanthomonas citri pv. fuscans]KGP31569.1 hypothetical protein NY65_05675 [Xanthomonas phaseoli pv. phaseoli]AZU20663.1 hypothetical protein AC612_05425 [Xanthomonas citri pv. fuscans]AZU91802.1 hypothetical protein AC614_05430 [Xanthomonas citri pv. fuscans]KGK67037.1 hypothetical protein NB99_04720 [Xanthomonas citri pv. fuscans]
MRAPRSTGGDTTLTFDGRQANQLEPLACARLIEQQIAIISYSAVRPYAKPMRKADPSFVPAVATAHASRSVSVSHGAMRAPRSTGGDTTPNFERLQAN